MRVCPTLIRSYALGLESGAISVDEVRKWADDFIISEGYDDRVADISLMTQNERKEAHSVLLSLSSGGDDWEALRLLGQRLSGFLKKEPEQLHEITKFLERLWMRNGYDTPEDFNFVNGIEDQFLLAEQGAYGTQEDVRLEVIEGLRSLSG